MGRMVTLRPGKSAYFGNQVVTNHSDSNARLRIETDYHVTTKSPQVNEDNRPSTEGTTESC